MTAKTYVVVRAWPGVEKGDELELESVHPSLVAHVKLKRGGQAELTPATPEAATTSPNDTGRPNNRRGRN